MNRRRTHYRGRRLCDLVKLSLARRLRIKVDRRRHKKTLDQY
ncbi:hypothetical protein N665_0631s0006 [Sinapis alba]|nr:hypothetical protein N665_0631s0006 [Sinapis alba]